MLICDNKAALKAVKYSAESIKTAMADESKRLEHNLLKQCSSGIELVEDLFSDSKNLKNLFSEKNNIEKSGKFLPQSSNQIKFKTNIIDDITDIVKRNIIGKSATGLDFPAPIHSENLTGEDILKILENKKNAEKVKETLNIKMTERVIKSWENCLPMVNDSLKRLQMTEAVMNVKKKVYDTPHKVVGLIDDWKTLLLNKKTHGYCSESVIRTCDPTAKIIKVQLPIAKFSDGTKGYHDRAMFIAMRKLNKHLENGVKLDGINLSSGWNFDFAIFSEHMNDLKSVMHDYYESHSQEAPEYLKKIPETFNNETIGVSKPQLRELIKDYSTKFKNEILENNKINVKDKISLVAERELALSTPFYHWLNESLNEIEKYTTKSKTVFTISGGNYGKDKFNPLSLAENVVTVGAMDKKGKIYNWSVNNTLVNNFTEGKFVSDDQKLVPYFIYRKNLWDKVSSFLQGKQNIIIEGTSLSSPFELMMRLKEKINI